MPYFLYVVLAVFWAWATLRFALERYAPTVFAATRVAHPLLVAGGTTYLCYPDLVQGLAAAGAVGLLVAVTDRVFGGGGEPTVIPTRPPRRGGLPELP